MKIVIAGGNGQLGSELRRQFETGSCVLGPLPIEVVTGELAFFDTDTLSITDAKALNEYMHAQKPDVVINCSAITNVDGCEQERQLAFAVNAVGARNLAIACTAVGAKLVHLSTDYVFAGDGQEPYSEYDLTAPQTIYGKTKLAGEEYVLRHCERSFIVRTSWLYGAYGSNFVKTILNAGRTRGRLQVVNDQFGNPTNAEELAFHLWLLAVSEEYGVFHCTGENVCTWYDFACEIIRLGGVEAVVEPCTTEEFPRPAKRPAYSALENRMLELTVGNFMREWQDALGDFFKNNLEALQ